MEWLALAIGNSRLHWAYFIGQELQQAWDTDYFSPTAYWRSQISKNLAIPPNLPLCMASVVTAQTNLWQPYAQQVVTLPDLPLQGLYPSLGIDRALAALGGGEKFGYPILVIDGGTALTVTGIDDHRRLVGGAIWPGLRLQMQALHLGTAALPEIQVTTTVERWALNTPEAIISGVLHSTLAGIKDFCQDWQQRFPQTVILVTGGDREILYSALSENFTSVKHSNSAAFWGMATVLNIGKL
jgi:type III pantothenate kinase